MCSKRDLLREKLKQIQQHANELKSLIESSPSVIKEHFLAESKKFDVDNDKQIEKLNERRKQLLKEIGEYEQTCVQKMRANESKMVEYVDKAKEWASQQRDQLGNSSHQPEASTLITPEMQEAAEKQLTNLRNCLLQTRAFQLGGQHMQFYEEEIKEDRRLQFNKLIMPKFLRTNEGYISVLLFKCESLVLIPSHFISR
jgi:hypothetical protein